MAPVWIKATKAGVALFVTAAVFTWVYVGWQRATGFDPGYSPALEAIPIALLPTLVFLMGIKRQTTVAICGAIIVLTTVPAWIGPLFSDNAFASFWAVFIVFPLTLVMSMVATILDERAVRRL